MYHHSMESTRSDGSVDASEKATNRTKHCLKGNNVILVRRERASHPKHSAPNAVAVSACASMVSELNFTYQCTAVFCLVFEAVFYNRTSFGLSRGFLSGEDRAHLQGTARPTTGVSNCGSFRVSV